eukprot:1341781-Amphidinium_carterae.1
MPIKPNGGGGLKDQIIYETVALSKYFGSKTAAAISSQAMTVSCEPPLFPSIKSQNRLLP